MELELLHGIMCTGAAATTLCHSPWVTPRRPHALWLRIFNFWVLQGHHEASCWDHWGNRSTEGGHYAHTSVGEKAKAELARYIGEAITDKNLLLWWKENSARYPTLIHLVHKYLCIPATSFPSERAFSIVGHIVNEKRACLLPETVNMMVFLAENLK